MLIEVALENVNKSLEQNRKEREGLEQLKAAIELQKAFDEVCAYLRGER